MFKVALVATVGILARLASAAPAVPEATALLPVRTYDAYGVAPRDMAAAHATVQVLLKDAGIDIGWRECQARGRSTSSNASCDEAVDTTAVLVRIASGASRSNDGALGYSLIDSSQHSGSLVTILADRIEATVARTHVDAGTLLGRVIAHEIGHILIGTTRHSRTGLMRARWLDDELQRNLASDWTLATDDALRLRRGFLSRSKTLHPADAVVAAAGR
jgi:hypothetical protein